jgi:hypothetical protein
MPKFSVPAFVITDLLARSRHVSRRVALMDSLVAGVAGSVTFGIILGALSKPRQRAGASAAPLLTGYPLVTEEGDIAVFLTWSAIPGATGYNVMRAVGSGAASQENSDLIVPPLVFLDDGTTNDLKPKTLYTYTVNAVTSTGTVSSNSVNVTTLTS